MDLIKISMVGSLDIKKIIKCSSVKLCSNDVDCGLSKPMLQASCSEIIGI